LVDEYQDTNRTQYDLIRLLVTNAETRRARDWRNRSVLLWVTRISRFIASGWQTSPFCWTFNKTLAMDCGRRHPHDGEVEENYRSGKHSQAANQLIANNTQRIDKILAHTRSR